MDVQTTNLWLAIIAITGVLQLVIVLGVAYYISQIVKRAHHAIDTVVAETRPLARQVTAALDDVADLVDRTRRAEASVTALVDRVGTTVDHVKTVALTRIWPAVGIARGLRVAAAKIREHRHRRARAKNLDELAESRFVDEGGSNARPIGTR